MKQAPIPHEIRKAKADTLEIRRVAGPIENIRGVLARHYLRLGAESRRFRFMAQISDEAVVDIACHASPLVLLGLFDGEVPRGVLEIAASAPGHAEIALSLEDDLHGHGHGRRLLEAGLDVARSMGIATADLFYMTSNRAVSHLVHEFGGHVRVDAGEVTAWIELGDGSSAAA